MDLSKIFRRQRSKSKRGKSQQLCPKLSSTITVTHTQRESEDPVINVVSDKDDIWESKEIAGEERRKELEINPLPISNNISSGSDAGIQRLNGQRSQNVCDVACARNYRWSFSVDRGSAFQSFNPDSALLLRRYTQGDINVKTVPMLVQNLRSHGSSCTTDSNHVNSNIEVNAGIKPNPTLYEYSSEAILEQNFDAGENAQAMEYDPTHFQRYVENGASSVIGLQNDDKDGCNSSWGSEFDSDSNVDVVSDDIVLNEDAAGIKDEQINPGNSEITKDVPDGNKKLKFLWKNAPSKKLMRTDYEDDITTFIDVQFSQERQPGPQLKTPPPDLLPHQSKRRNIVETIIRSENSYIDTLERLEVSYKKVLLQAKPPIIHADLVEKIFYKVTDILQCHQLFQIALNAAISDWDEHEKIGDTFVASFSKSMVLECYSSYINNFTAAMELVRKMCKQKPTLLSFLRERQNESTDRLNLYGLMLKPVQRFPQFILLVQDLLKHTPDDHDDRLPLQLALTELETLAENLNLRRADDQEKLEMAKLVESSNIKLISNTTKDGRIRRLLKQSIVREIAYADDGSVEKDRECLLVLTNDLLLSCSTNSRRPQARSGTFRDLYKLKWCTTLDILTISDFADTFMKDPEELTKITEDLESLLFIREKISQLHNSYPALSRSLDGCISEILERQPQSTPKHEENSITVRFPQKSTDYIRTLVMPDGAAYSEWMESILNAKLACDPKNLHCWFSADGSDPDYLWRPPLFLSSITQRPLQVQCAHAFMLETSTTFLWLACYSSTVVATVYIYKFTEERTEKMHAMQVDSSVQCMEHWNPYQISSSSVWLGMECGSLIEYSAEFPHRNLCEVAMPTMSTVMIMRAFKKELYVGLLDGTLVMYTRPEGQDGLHHVRSISVGSGPLKCLSPNKGKLWGVSGNQVVTIDMNSFKIVSTRAIVTEEPVSVSHVVQVGSGFWVAFNIACNLHLYHLDSLQLLQDLNLSRAIRDFYQGLGWQIGSNKPWSITCLSSSYNQLLVGTSIGLILGMPLPKLPGSVPKITGPCRICYHMFSAPVNFLCAPSLPGSHVSGSDVSTNDEDPEQEEVPPQIPVRSPTKMNMTLHRRTSSEGLINVHNSTSLSHEKSKRFSSAEESIQINNEMGSIDMSPTPPALPPKPKSGTQTDVTSESSQAQSASDKTEKSSVPCDKARIFPVLLACGDKYMYVEKINSKYAEKNDSQKSSAILSWKIVL